MDIKEFRDEVENAGFSEEATEQMLEIVDGAIERGDLRLSDEESEQIEALISTEAELADQMADANDDMADMLEEFVSGLNEGANQVAVDSAAIENKLEKELSK